MGTLKPPASGVTVRMYRQGLGDCFLLAFPTDQADGAYYVLIDCGVASGTAEAERLMVDVATDVEAATGGEIHLLIVTHAHWDHVSGFAQAARIFQRMRVHDLWLAWTEDPADPPARRLRADLGRDRDALQLIMRRARDPGAVQQVAALLGFFGEPTAAPAAAAGVGTEGDAQLARDALQVVHGLAAATGAAARYRRSGEGPLTLAMPGGPRVPGARVYVLGPPRDGSALRRTGSSARGQPPAPAIGALTAREAFLLAVRDPAVLAGEEADLHELSFPFTRNLRIPRAEAERQPFFQAHYGVAASDAMAWRRIDDDWLGSAGDVALQLDHDANNTSLVLAIELVHTGKVLLFVGDAQVGSWRSWEALSWSVADATGTEQQVRTRDLLRRTVLYKVGHHGSGHGTPYGAAEPLAGLELMDSAELVAMLPVDQAVARQRGWAQLPSDPLLRRLAEQTAGRLLRSDVYPQPRPAGMSDAAWAAFEARLVQHRLYYQYTVTD